MFPNADVPVAQLSVDTTLSPEQIYDIGRRLAPLRDEDYFVFASGNVVHNLSRVEWDNPGGSPLAAAFNDYVKQRVLVRDDAVVVAYE